MIDKSYYNNASSKNILNEYKQKNLTNSTLNSFGYDMPLENMVLNSNLNNGNIIK